MRVHFDVDVGGSYGVKRGIKHTVLVSYLAKKLGMPVRLIEDRLENMRGGDMHGPDRIFDLEVAFLFPWAVALGDIGIFGFWSMMLFLGVLTVGFIYEWRKGALEWE